MTEASIRRLTTYYETISPRIFELTQSFYDRLFRACPEVRPLFQIEIPIQSQHLAAALALIVRNLRMLDLLEEPLMELGIEHAKVGVRPEHYPIVVQTMIEALHAGSGDLWTDELGADWAAVLKRIGQIMMEGAIRAARASLK